MSHLLYLMFRCDRGCDGKFGKFGNFVGSKHTQEEVCRRGERHYVQKMTGKGGALAARGWGCGGGIRELG